MTIAVFVLGVLFALALCSSWPPRRDAPYTGEMINQLIDTVDLAFLRRLL
jgi:uncharacterized protein YggT (Ycf19 family)